MSRKRRLELTEGDWLKNRANQETFSAPTDEDPALRDENVIKL